MVYYTYFKRMAKTFYSYEQIHQLICDNCEKLKEFNPDYIVAIGGGGFISARIVRTYIDVPLLSVTVKLYDENDKPGKVPVVHQWLDNNRIEELKGKKVLIVDEVDDSRVTLNFVCNKMKEDGITDLGVFVLQNKLKNGGKKAQLPEDVFYVSAQNIKDVWVVYPWDAEDIVNHNKLVL